ncbi:NlpC/P60 family protein [Burkholderia gladioli]|uniref:NlpC/P60 family protein n=1 Tax=Burkholderia gladioli TaxID=28095 RepID=UPI003B50645F
MKQISPSSYIGIPFRIGGRDRKGLDCYGLVLDLVEMDTGVRPPDYPSSTDGVVVQMRMLEARESWKKVPVPKRGTVVLFRIGRLIRHVGYMLSETRFIHTWEGVGGVVTERLDDWKHRVAGFYEYQSEAEAAPS